MQKDQLFTWADRGFWLVWAGLPWLVWTVVQATIAAPEALAAQRPDLAACIASLPSITTAHPLAQAVFWGAFALENLVYALLLAQAHLVIHRCARREVFVPPMIAILRRIGAILMGFPLLDLGLTNLIGWTLRETGDAAVFQPAFVLDLPVLGLGLLLLGIAHAMRLGVALQRDAALTI